MKTPDLRGTGRLATAQFRVRRGVSTRGRTRRQLGELSGVVESVGADVDGFAPGDRVIGYVTHGAGRERVAVPAQRLFKLTAALDLTAPPG